MASKASSTRIPTRRRAGQGRARRQSLPLRHLHGYPQGRARSRQRTEGRTTQCLTTSWPPMEQAQGHRQAHQPPGRTAKSSGRAKYTSDINPQGLLFAALSDLPARPRARQEHRHQRRREDDRRHGRPRDLQTPAPRSSGQGTEVAVVAADHRRASPATPSARSRSITKCCRTSSNEDDLGKAGTRAQARRRADHRRSRDRPSRKPRSCQRRQYGIPVITHCCLEPHGSVIQWQGDQVESLALHAERLRHRRRRSRRALKVPAAQHPGPDGLHRRRLRQQVPGRPLGRSSAPISRRQRRQAGQAVPRPRHRTARSPATARRTSRKIKVGAKKDGTITAWQSTAWATGGFGGGGMPPLPYVFTQHPEHRLNHIAVSLNTGPQRAWRAPNHPAGFLPHLLRPRGFRRQS